MKTIILNHKCYLSIEEIEKYKKEIEKIKTKENLVLLPNTLYLSLFKNSTISYGTQNFYTYKYGSYTGEICLESLKNINATYTIVGHPERILLKLDSYEQIKNKLFVSLNMGFKTILCIGHDENLSTIKKELKYYLKGIEYSSLKNLFIAYEPSSKIEGEKVNIKDISYLSKFLKEYFEKHFEETVPFLYGGSVNINNINEILAITDGVILGKISTDINEVKNILKNLKYE